MQPLPVRHRGLPPGPRATHASGMEPNNDPAGAAAGSPAVPDPATVQADWDERYAGRDALWSGEPNGALVAEAAALSPGRALDVGCGEGADALWLASRGWDVTALDVSRVALDRAAREAAQRSLTVNWLHAGLVEADLPPEGFDLVSAQYPALLRTGDNAAERALLCAVAPGGVLLVVHHAMPAAHEAPDQAPVDMRDYVLPGDIAAALDRNWEVEVNETRPRHVRAGAGSHHTEDVVLRARRLR